MTRRGASPSAAAASALSGRSLNSYGAATWAGTASLAIINGGTFNNLAGASFTVEGQGHIGTGDGGGFGSGSFNNAGSFTESAGRGPPRLTCRSITRAPPRSPAGHLASPPAVRAPGRSPARPGPAALRGQPRPLGAISGDTVKFNQNYVDASPPTTYVRGPYSATTATIVNDTPTVHFTGPVSSVGSDLDINFHATADFSPVTPVTLTVTTLTVSSGSLTSTDSFVVDGLMSWTGYNANIGGGCTIDAYGGIAIDSLSGGLDGCALNNHGAATWTGGGTIGFYNGAVFNNLAGASFDARCDGQLGRGYPDLLGSGSFNNAGSFTKSAGAGTTEVDAPFNNTGTASVASGTLSLAAGGTSTGPFTGAAGTMLLFEGSHDLSGAISGDTVKFNQNYVRRQPPDDLRPRPLLGHHRHDRQRHPDRPLHRPGLERGQRPRHQFPCDRRLQPGDPGDAHGDHPDRLQRLADQHRQLRRRRPDELDGL